MKRAYRRRYHYIYKTTCVITGKYYLGMHSTDDLHDGYVGSGKRLGYSIRKHGKENHVVEILEHYFTREWLREREAELVCTETLTDPMCMNLKLGGEGGFEHINNTLTTEKRKEICSVAGKAAAVYFKNNPEKCKARYAKSCLGRKGLPGIKGFLGKSHTEITKVKMSETHEKNGKSNGNGNSQYNTCWIYSLTEKRNIKIAKSRIDEYIANGWLLGRKIKW